MRLAYLDEAGVSNPEHEPYLVVAGVILDGDQDWQLLDRHLRSIARRHLPEQDRNEFVFHAKDLWHGSGYFHRDRWRLDRRMEILSQVVAIPRKFHLPVVAGASDRPALKENLRRQWPDISNAKIDVWSHVEAYMQAVAQVDRWMEQHTRNELAMVVAEDTPHAKRAIKALHVGMGRDDDAYWEEEVRGFHVFSTNKIVDTVHFADKQESSLLQIADACAFVIKRHLTGKSDVADLFKALESQLAAPRRGDAWMLYDETLPRLLRVSLPREQVQCL